MTAIALFVLAIGFGSIRATLDNDIRRLLRLAGKVTRQDVLDTGSIAGLCIDRSTGNMGRHCISADTMVVTICVMHALERMALFGRGLLICNVASVAEEVAALEGGLDVLGVDNGTASGVDDPGALLHPGDLFGVDEALGAFVEGAVDGEDVELGEELLEVFDTDGAGVLFEEVVALVVVVGELGAVEWLQSLKDTGADASRAKGTDDLALEVVRLAYNLGNVPVTGEVLTVGGDKVADEDENGHEDVLSDRDDVGAGDFVDGNLLLVGSVEVDMVGADTGGDAALEVLGGLDHLSRKVSGVEGGGDDNVGVLDVLAELGVGRVLVGSDNVLVALLLEPVSNAELVLDSAEQTRLLVTVLAGRVEHSENL